MGFGPRPGQGRFSLSLFHTWRFTDEIIVRPGLPVIDNLSGSTATQSQQEVELESRVFKDGIGGNVTIRWEDGRKVDGVAGNPDLTFGDQTKVNVGLFIDFDQRKTWLAKAPVLKGTRIGINIQNLFDTRQEVRSSAGAPPLNYQSDFLDPQGRTIGFFLRKVLF
ncbi:TonB-dependent receptor [Caulobacter sp. SLTY]|nr:TonB-dependent receptor [Caulobacter sp. SLTY]